MLHQSAGSNPSRDFYNTLPPVNATLLNGPITSAALAPFDLFVLVGPEVAITAAEAAAHAGFLAAGRTLVLIGDNASTPMRTAI